MGNEGGPGPVGRAGDGSGAADAAPTEESPTDELADGSQSGPSTCATCWQEIPPDTVRCPHCVTADGCCEGDPEMWSYDRVVLAVVPADGARAARASAATAFARGRTIVSGPDVSHGEVTLWAAFEDPPPSDLTEGWPELPAAVPMASATGGSLFETAASRCEQPGTPDPVMYAEDGATIADGAEAETLAAVVEDAAVQYWVVPGVVKRYALPEEPDAFGDPLYCVDCGAVTEHDRTEDGADAGEDRARRVWACRVCGAQRYGPD